MAMLAPWAAFAESTNDLLSAVRDVADDFSVFYQPEVRSAYQSRAKIVEDRPIQVNYVKAAYDTHVFGRIGCWNWHRFSLTGRRDNVHHRSLNEVDWGIFVNYDWKIAEDWTLFTEATRSWITLPNWRAAPRAAKSDASMLEWRFEQALKNPWLTPFYLLRRSTHPGDWLYVRAGVKRTFPLPCDFAFTPQFNVENGDERHFCQRYGSKPGGGSYHSGVQAANAILELSWKAGENLSFYVAAQQFSILSDDARGAVKARKSPDARRDLTIATIGARIRF